MREILADIVRQTAPLGFEALKVTGTDDRTMIQAITENKALSMEAVLHAPESDLNGEFGCRYIGLLNGLLNNGNFRGDGSTISIKRKKLMSGGLSVEQIEFRGGGGAYADVKCMNPRVCPPMPEVRPIPWDVSFTPDKAKVLEFQQFSGLYGDFHKSFLPKTEDGNLVFSLGEVGDGINHSSMVFQRDVGGSLTGGGMAFNNGQFIAVMKVAAANQATIHIYAPGIMKITVRTEIATYDYYLRGGD